MRVVNAKSLVTLAAVVLVVPFAVAAGLIGAGAVGGVESVEHKLLLAVLAVGAALIGVAKNSERVSGRVWGESKALHITAREREGYRATTLAGASARRNF
ncbi:MAG TPA: hypothetical protein VFX96_17790 [Pyrinomonadaceae bacterium]|nr:hypothetical protein [Pyrinomonadaceae bacterium]